MAYGEIKVDTITFTDGGIDKSVTISGLVQNPTFSGNITVTGTISGNTVRGQTISGVTVTGTTAQFTSGTFTTITGGVATITSGVFAAGSAASPSITFTGDLNTGIYSPGADQVAISTNGTRRLIILSDGKVGLGAASVLQQGSGVDGGSAAGVLELYNGGTGNTTLENTGAFPILFKTNGSERLRITSAGLVGIGTSAPSVLLHSVVSSAGVAYRGGHNNTGFDVYVDDSTGEARLVAKRTGGSGGKFMSFYTDTGSGEFERARIDSSGRLGIGTSSPAFLIDASGSASTGIRYKSTGLYGGIATDNSNATGGGFFAAFQNGIQKSIFGVVGGFAGSTNSDTGVFAETGQGIQFFTNGAPSTAKAVITSAGNVGIGTTSPSSLIHAVGTAANLILDRTSDSPAVVFKSNGTNIAGISTNNSNIRFEIGSGLTEAARIDSSGRLLVGTSSARSNFYNSSDHTFIQLEGVTNPDSSFSIVQNYNSNTNGPSLVFGKNNSQTKGTNVLVSSGDTLGRVSFQGNDGAEFVAAADITVVVDGTPGANDMPGRLVFSTTADGASSPTERMRIDSLGTLKVSNNNTYAAANYHQFNQNASSQWTLGALGRNATDPYGIRVEYTNAAPNGTVSQFLYCVDTAGVKAEIRSNGGLANFQANNVNLSDRNAKKDIAPAAGTWDCIKQWEIVNYRYKDQPDDADLNLGVIAQQVAESCPEVITVFQEAKEATEDQPAQEERLGIKEQQMYWMAIKALQEAQVRIEALEAEVAALKAQ